MVRADITVFFQNWGEKHSIFIIKYDIKKRIFIDVCQIERVLKCWEILSLVLTFNVFSHWLDNHMIILLYSVNAVNYIIVVTPQKRYGPAPNIRPGRL